VLESKGALVGVEGDERSLHLVRNSQALDMRRVRKRGDSKHLQESDIGHNEVDGPAAMCDGIVRSFAAKSPRAMEEIEDHE
jgi:hypothetical protein